MTPRSVLIALLVVLAVSLPAQETRGSIAGRITDPAAMPVADCPVTVSNVDNGAVFHATSNASGYYEVSLLVPGSYEVTAKATGFKQVLRKGITVQVASRVDVAIVLELGSVSETVSITADAPLLDTDSGSSGRVIDSHVLNDVPVLNNMSLLLADFTPGVQTAGVNSWVSYHSGGGGLVYSVNGGVGGNDYSLDGVPNNSGRGAAFPARISCSSSLRITASPTPVPKSPAPSIAPSRTRS